MPKIELLVPAGDYESLKQAIHNGCDAVYLGGKSFGARAFSNNFDKNELTRAVRYAHLYDVKIYITVNTLIFEEEITSFLEYIDFLISIKVDAFIMQDLGMIKRVREMYPTMIIHASTQFHNYNNDTLEVLKKLGVNRAVMARELSLDEINSMECSIEKEVFIHGALCISYSGQCLFSSLVGGRSGNRGECAGSCRLPYELMEDDKLIELDDKYLLSPRELNTSKQIDELLKSNITSLKIEGRMKSPIYVGFITKLYRTLIDNYYNNKENIIDEKTNISLHKIFNRKFTEGFLFNTPELMNINTPNHLGVLIGEVISTDKKYIKIKLSDDLNQGDGIRFANTNIGMITNYIYNENNLLINKAKKDDVIYLDNKDNLLEKCNVLKTTDIILNNELENYSLKKINIDVKVIAKLNEKLYISFSDSINTVSSYGDIVNSSITSPITKDNVSKQLNKLNETVFTINNLDILLDDNVFISVGQLNKIRRDLSDELTILRENSGVVHLKNDLESNNISFLTNKLELNILVRNEEQLNICIKNNIDNIYLTDYNLYEKYKNNYSNIYYRINRINKNNDDFINDKLLITDISGLKYNNNNNILVSDYYLNITNSYSVNTLKNMNVNKITLSVELSDKTINNIIKSYSNNKPNIELIIYGKIELMIMKYCPLNLLLNKDNKCQVCKNNHQYFLIDRNKEKYPIINENCISHIFNYRNMDKLVNIRYYRSIGINSFRIELFDEDEKETVELITKFKNHI